MAKRGSIIQDDSDMSEINISPMIDMVFILLIFFIVTTVFVQEPGVEVTRAPASSAHQLERNSILIAVTSSGTVHYGGTEVGVNGIRSIVQRFMQDNPDMPVIIQADTQSPAHTIIRLLEQSKIGGAKYIHISTAKRRS
ncbi:MAG: biopolymer transporter ExbD [Opitutales bacterium]|nr:biopolymer transporter ExbD [Opitutales bacterium]